MGFSEFKVKLGMGAGRARTEEEDAEAEIARNLWRNYKILPPRSDMRDRWDMLLLTFILINFITIPLVLFYWDSLYADRRQGIFVLDRVMDSFFFIDIVLNFRTAYKEGEEHDHSAKLVHEWKLIGKKYLKTWFIVDFMAIN